MKECVIIDGVRTANARAHAEKGWFRNVRPENLLIACYNALFQRNPKVRPDQIEAVFCGCANITGMQNDIGRLAWLAGGFPDIVAANTLTQQCPSGMSALEHAARAIMCGEGDTYIVSGIEDMQKVPMAMGMDFAPGLFERYDAVEIPMGSTAEKVARLYGISRADQESMALWSHRKAADATSAGKFRNEIVSVAGHREDGTPFMVDEDQWIRPGISLKKMAAMQPVFDPNGVVTVATSSPLTAGGAALLLMERKKADKLGLSYHLKYVHGSMAGCDPTLMGIGPIPACRKLLERTRLTIRDIDVWEINEAFASQALACLRELGIAQNAPFENVNVWGGALALGHPLGESGARIVVTLNSIMKTDRKKAMYGIAMLCGGFGNGNAVLLKRVG